MEVLLITAGLLWGLPIVLCVNLGQSRNRTGWAWGLLLGWLGVLILAIMKPIPLHVRIAEAEAEEKLRLSRVTPDNPRGIYPPPRSFRLERRDAKLEADQRVAEMRRRADA